MAPVKRRGGLTAAQTRLGWAIIIASAIGPLSCTVGSLDWTGFFRDADIGYLLWWLLMCFVTGWPVALVLVALGAFAIGKKIQQRNSTAIGAAVLLGVVLGAVVTPVVYAAGNPGGGDPRMKYIGAVGGLLVGICFCLIAPMRTEETAGVPPSGN